MRKFRHSVMTLAMTLAVSSLSAKDVTGFLTGSNEMISPGIYTTPLEVKGELTPVQPMMFSLFGGAYGQHMYWCFLSQDVTGNMMEGLVGLDPTTWSRDYTKTVDYGCTDLTYDYTSSQMYGILSMQNGTTIPHQLVRIELPSGEMTSVSALDGRFHALACDLWGNMYAMSSTGTLCRIDQNTGRVTPIGSTGVVADTSQAQSLEFDRETGELYWSFLDANEDSQIAKLDKTTGAILSKHTMTSNGLLGGLYIPFDDPHGTAPNRVDYFTVNATDEQVSFSWTTPDMAIDGTTLTQPMRVEVRRAGELVKSYDNVAPAIAQSWTDTEAPKGVDLRYAITCYDQDGRRGYSCYTTVHLGADVPAAVGSLAASASGNDALLTWDAPTVDRNGRPIDDASALKYRVVRTPGAKEWKDISGTTFTDNEIAQYGTYTYTVYPSNECGEGAPASLTVTLGPALQMPWYPNLSDAATTSQFTVLDKDEDSFSWIPKNGTFEINTINNWRAAADDWLITPPLHLEAGVTYKLRYTLGTPGFADENFRLTFGTDVTPESQTRILHEEHNFMLKSKDLTEDLVVETSGSYTLGFYCNTFSDDPWALIVSNISIEPVGAVDLKVNELSGETDLTVGEEATFNVEVANNGTEAQIGFNLSLVDAEGNLLASTQSDATLEPAATTSVSISWTPLNANVKEIRARVQKEGDVNTVNDFSAPRAIRFLNPDDAIVNVGKHDSNPGSFPFNFEDLYSYAQSIYSGNEIGISGGYIKEISWTYNNPGDALNDKDIKVYMANTAMPVSSLTFTSAEQRELVYDGKASFLPGENTLTLTLDEPFPYAGGNLLIYTEKIHDIQTGLRVTFAAQNFPETPRTLISYNSTGVLNPSQGMVSSMLPCITLVFNTDGGGSLGGTVTDADGLPVYNAVVTLDGKKTETATDVLGRYNFSWLPAGAYDMTVTPSDYTSLLTTGSSSIVADAATTFNFSLPARPSAPLSGVIKDTKGNPVPRAAVVASSWISQTVTTDEQGAYSFPKLYQHDNLSISVFAPGYTRADKQQAYPADAPAALDLEVEALHNPVTEAAAVIASGKANIFWEPVHFGFDHISDNGRPFMAVESPTYGLYLFGKRFDGPLAVYNAQWHAAESEAGSVDYIDIYVYGLNESGAPTTLLTHVENVPNTENAWNEYRFDEPLFAPYGCIVAFTAPESISLSQDDQPLANSYLIDLSSNGYAPLTDEDGAVNLMIRINAAYYNTAAGYAEPAITYNVTRLDENQNSSEVETDYTGEPSVFDSAWDNLEAGRYRYAINVTYPDGFVTDSFITNGVQKANSGIDAADAGTLRLYSTPGALVIESATPCTARIHTPAGVHMATVEVAAGRASTPLASGIYVVSIDNATYKVIVK